ncbi:MAG: hypothetical protein LRZ85_01670 [Alphaproteobacteria bacterium]|nr:hypothetical protein [Alphaproteobacteria bacterium]MCD8526265.1 hypothetical protein [Alphaproteobacteria bacterium]
MAPVAPTPIDPAMEPAPAPAAEPVAPTPPSEPEAAPAEEEHGSLDNKAIEVEQLAPAAGEEASGAAAIDLTAPME